MASIFQKGLFRYLFLLSKKIGDFSVKNYSAAFNSSDKFTYRIWRRAGIDTLTSAQKQDVRRIVKLFLSLSSSEKTRYLAVHVHKLSIF